MSFKTIKKHRTEFPQIYEIEVGETTKFRVVARKVGYLGKQDQRFDKLSEAKECAREIAGEIKDKGLNHSVITPLDRFWITKGKEMLLPYNVSFEDCFKREVQYQETLRRNFHHQPIKELAPEWVKFKEAGAYRKLRDKSLRQIRQFSNHLIELWADKIVSTITKNDVKTWILSKKWSLQTKKNRRNLAHSFFEWVRTEKLQITINPCTEIIFEVNGDDNKGVQILTNAQVEHLFTVCVQEDTHLIPYLALCTFAGLRPDEALRMKMKNVTNGHIEVEPWMSKTKEGRIIPIHPTLDAWLKKYPSWTGDSIPSNFRKRWDRMRAKSGYKHWKLNKNGAVWIQDGLRHTFATNWLAVNNDRPRLAEVMGNSLDMIRDHYRKPVTKEHGEKFFAILPK